MVASECRIETSRASRYLVQLCRHARVMSTMQHPTPGAHRPPRVLEANYTDTTGLVQFEDGTWLLTADTDTLHLRVDAVDSAALARLEAGISARIKTIGRRDRLDLAWSPVATPTPLLEPELARVDPRPTSRRARMALLLVVLTAVVVAHLAVGAVAVGGALATGWLTLVGVLGVGAAALAVHVLVARAVLSGGRLPGSPWHGRHQRRGPLSPHEKRPPEN